LSSEPLVEAAGACFKIDAVFSRNNLCVRLIRTASGPNHEVSATFTVNVIGRGANKISTPKLTVSLSHGYPSDYIKVCSGDLLMSPVYLVDDSIVIELHVVACKKEPTSSRRLLPAPGAAGQISTQGGHQRKGDALAKDLAKFLAVTRLSELSRRPRTCTVRR
jgi:hypothetical protein